MPRLDIDALRCLCAIADHGGVTRAAQMLSLSQSAVSHRIRRLEDLIGQDLLARRPGAPLLTDAGVRLLAYGRRICALHDEAVHSLSPQPLAGRIRLGMTEDVSTSVLARLLGRFTRLFPAVTVRTHVRQSLVLQRELAAGDIDLALMQIFVHDQRSDDQILYRDRLLWVQAADNRLPDTGPTPFLSYDPDCFYRQWAMQAEHQPPAGLRTVLDCASSAGIAEAVRAGLGVALLPERHVSADMTCLQAPFPPPPDLAYVLRLGRRSRSAPVTALARDLAAGLAPPIGVPA